MKIFENQCITRRAFLTTDTDKNLLFDSRSIEKYWKLEICPRRATGTTCCACGPAGAFAEKRDVAGQREKNSLYQKSPKQI